MENAGFLKPEVPNLAVSGRPAPKKYGELAFADQTATALAAEIASSPYSFTFSQNTGALLQSRLKAVYRSINTLHPSHDDLHTARDVLDYLNERPPEPHQHLLASLTEPFMDAMPVALSKSSRPPTLFRRASSALLSQSQEDLPMPPKRTESVVSLSPTGAPAFPSTPPKTSIAMQPPSPQSTMTVYRGIATPLQHLPTKQSSRQAQLTTSSEYPYGIKTMNDVAFIHLGKKAQSRNLAEMFPEEYRQRIRDHLGSRVGEKVLLSGQLVEMSGSLVSLWVERSGRDAIVWLVENVQTAQEAIPSSQNQFGTSVACTDHIFRIPATSSAGGSASSSVVVQGLGHLWAPPVIACTVLVSPALYIVDYNEAVMKLLLGTDVNLRGERFARLVPQFSQFWPVVKQQCIHGGMLTPGVVIPEHKFRALAGVPFDSPEFISADPSQEHSIELVTEFGKLCVDLHLRIVDSDLISIWVSYSRLRSDSIFMDANVSTVTPPQTPLASPGIKECSPKDDYSELLQIKVGEHRREKKYESFQHLKLLGKGGYGEVHLVLTPSKRHTVVLKSIYKDTILVDTWSRDRVLGTIPNEIRVLNQLRSPPHPNIVQMIDFFEDERCYHVEMIPCIGSGVMDLFDFIETRGTTISMVELMRIWCQIVTAVAYVHSLGIVHRDLKDENVIMDSQGYAKLIDFGSSAYVNRGPFDVFVGTIDYAAPEVVEGQLYEGIPQDNWALGVLLYVMAVREPPFKSADEIVEAQYQGISSLDDKATVQCDDMIRRLLSRVPSDRPTAAQVLEMID